MKSKRGKRRQGRKQEGLEDEQEEASRTQGSSGEIVNSIAEVGNQIKLTEAGLDNESMGSCDDKGGRPRGSDGLQHG